MGYNIVFEGIDGCGKDSQADLLAHYLTGPEHHPLRINEPCNDLPTGQLLRQFLASGAYPQAHAALFLADRMALQHTRILPALQAGADVISVRSFVSTLAYQQEQWPLQYLFDIHRMLPAKPDVIFILDVDPEVGLERIATRGGKREYYEALDFQRRNRQRYLDLATDPRMKDMLADGGRIIVLDSTLVTANDLHETVKIMLAGCRGIKEGF